MRFGGYSLRPKQHSSSFVIAKFHQQVNKTPFLVSWESISGTTSTPMILFLQEYCVVLNKRALCVDRHHGEFRRSRWRLYTFFSYFCSFSPIFTYAEANIPSQSVGTSLLKQKRWFSTIRYASVKCTMHWRLHAHSWSMLLFNNNCNLWSVIQ